MKWQDLIEQSPERDSRELRKRVYDVLDARSRRYFWGWVAQVTGASAAAAASFTLIVQSQEESQQLKLSEELELAEDLELLSELDLLEDLEDLEQWTET